MPLKITRCKEGIQFAATLQPRASRNEITGLHNDSLKIRLTSPPVDGAANRTCVKFLAKELGIRPSSIRIVSGLTSRRKTIRIEDMDEAGFLKKLSPLIPEAH
ncbi:MAG: DUF167 domain-containing protein [Nitrospinaceae bacterium]